MKLTHALIFIPLWFFFGCAGSQQQFVKVPTHKFSYKEPSSGWERLFSENTIIEVGDVNIPAYTASWANSLSSSITVLAVDLSDHPNKPTKRKATIRGIEEWIKESLDKVCSATRFNIIEEENGTYKESAEVYKLSSEVECESGKGGDTYITKLESHAIDLFGIRYRFQFSAPSQAYDKDYKVFAEFLESIGFI